MGENSGLRLMKRLVWRLPILMAEHKIRTATELKRRLADIGYDITSVHVARLVHERPQRISSDLLDALINIFDCTANEILAVEMVPEGEEARKPVEISSRQHKSAKASEKKQPKVTRANIPKDIPLENITGPKLHALPNPYKKVQK